MRLRCCSLLAAAACTIYFIASGITGFSVSADAVTTKTLTPQETRDLIGSTISAQYYDGSGMVDFSFEYGGSATLGTMLVDGSPSLSFSQGDTVIWYSAQINPNLSPQYITVDVRPRYSFFDTSVISQMCGLSCGTVPGTSAYSPPSWRWRTSYAGDMIIENQLTANSVYYAICNVAVNGVQQHFTFIDAVFSQQSTFSAYSDRALFYGNGATSASGVMYFFVTCPTISLDSTMASGTNITTSSAGSGDITVDVTVDMTETNGLLGSLLDVLEGIVDAIAGLFVPSEEALEDFKDDMEELCSEHLGGLYEANDLILDYADTFTDTEAAETITFPAVSIPLAGASFEFGGWQVPLKIDEFEFVYTVLALIIDFICTATFLNMCKKKLEIFLSPEGEVISSDS